MLGGKTLNPVQSPVSNPYLLVLFARSACKYKPVTGVLYSGIPAPAGPVIGPKKVELFPS